MNRFIMRRITRLDSQARDLEARGTYHQALELRKELCELAREHLKQGHPWLIDQILELATSYRRLNDWTKAEETYQEALSHLEHEPSATQDKLAQTLNTVGVFYCEIDCPGQAIECFSRAILILQASNLGSPELATLHNNLASSFHSLGCADEARQHYREALRIFAKEPPSPKHAHCLCDLAELLTEEEDEESSLKIKEALKSFRQLYEPNSPDLARAKMRIADLYCRAATPALAKGLLEEAAQAFSLSDQHANLHSECLEILCRLEPRRPDSQ